ncbi:hypothetical protein M514_08279 [Trichuris suis]|uniref:Uncharacterized protein n=1 Tax=Trichuris suis TaxID=68888 RepID=A0A085NHH5_9BILA|nr:hypothetical protein M513_08279 [Trichuris suis]KFD68921.1 hypothetical protein M514_08279 [Trichuris suis]
MTSPRASAGLECFLQRDHIAMQHNNASRDNRLCLPEKLHLFRLLLIQDYPSAKFVASEATLFALRAQRLADRQIVLPIRPEWRTNDWTRRAMFQRIMYHRWA